MKYFFTLFLIPFFIFGITPKEKLKQLLNEKGEIKNYFSKQFIDKVPPSKISPILKKYYKDCGEGIVIVKTGDHSYDVIGSKMKFPAKIALDNDQKISMLWFGVLSPIKDSLEDIIKDLKKIKGGISFYIDKDGKELSNLNGDKPYGVGSTFKLYILKALSEKIKKSKKLSWKTVIKLKKQDRSLPSGILQAWPIGTPITLRTLANLMISISDNTATDHLLTFVGREKIEKIAPKSSHPFLKTSEMFKLKWGVKKEVVDNYLKSDKKGKKAILKNKISKFPLKKVDISKISKPLLIDKIEWFLSTKDCVKMIKQLRNNPSISINGGLVDTKEWHYVGYKGGSEPGVLNYTIMLQKTKKSPLFTFSATINTEDLKEVKEFTPKIMRVIALIKGGKI